MYMTTFLTSSSVLRRSVGALLLVAVIIATTNGQATATTEWGQATPAVFADGVQNATPDAYFDSVSCASAGNCVAAGNFWNLAGDYEAFTMSMVAGVWGQATPAVFADGVQNATPDARFDSVSCGSAGHCVAAGNFKNLAGDDEAFTMSMVAGVWGQATPAVFADGVQNATPDTYFDSVSCASAGNCVAAGYFENLAGGYEAFTMTAVNNTPAPTTTVAPSTTVASSTTVAPSTTVASSTTVAPPTESVVVALPVATTPLVVSG